MIFLFGFGLCQVEIEPRQEIQPRENSGCGSPDFSNDQQCDDENNNAECNFDGGACCNNNIAGWDEFCTDCECLQVIKLRLWSFMLYT